MRGKIHIKNEMITTDIKSVIKGLKDGVYDYEITKWAKVRSSAENRYYHGVVVRILSEHTGYESDEIHEILRAMFLSEKQRLKWDRRKKVEIRKSTSTLTTTEFEKFMEEVKRWSMKELGCYIPDPNEPPGWTEAINPNQ